MKLQRIIAVTAVAAFTLSTLTACPWDNEEPGSPSSSSSSSSTRPSHDDDNDDSSGDDTSSSTPEDEEGIIEGDGFTFNQTTNTYSVENEDGLQAWAEAVTNDLTINCTLETDITVSNWSPVQDFSGKFDGQGHTIKGLTSALFDTVSGDH